MVQRFILAVILINPLFAQEWFTLEGEIFKTIHQNMKCSFFDKVVDGVEFVSDTRKGWFVPIALYTLGSEREYQAAKLATFGLAISGITTIGLKYTFNRQRPSGEYSRWDSSFPSGHTTTAVTTSVIYSNFYPKLTIPLIIYSTLVGFARVYAGEHYPTDVLAGGLLGCGIGFMMVKFKQEFLAFP